MSRHKRKHHYMYMKAGGIIVAMHYGVWLIIAIAGSILMAYLYKFDRHMFNTIIDWAIVAGVVIFIGLCFVLWSLWQGNKAAPQYTEHRDHSQCQHTLEREARECAEDKEAIAAYQAWLRGELAQLEQIEPEQPTTPLRRVV